MKMIVYRITVSTPASIIALALFLSLSALCWAQSSSPYWTGDGGRGMTLAVLEPSGNV